ncbi:MAG: sulfatase-like hydrolase/transferase [Chitinophagaceae bacterium]
MTSTSCATSPPALEPLRGTHKDSIVGLTPDYTSVATLLQRNGYETYLVGKWHLGYGPAYSPNKNGFDYFFGFNAGGTDYISHTNRKGEPDLYENGTAVKREGYLTDIWGEKAIELIKQKHTKPFFLSLMFNAPHWPVQAPGDKPFPPGMNWHSGGTKEKYAAMIKSMDEAVGRIMQAVEEENLAGNTLIIFTSDNGGEEFSDMGVYSGKKETLWEGGIREPAFIRWPGVIPGNTVTQQVAITMDWTAIILAAAGVQPDPAFPPDGINLLPVLTGKKKIIERTFYWRLSQEFKYKAIRDGNWKYLQTANEEFLFNLVDDPGEKNDLKAVHPSILESLKKKYSKWSSEMLEPVPL